MISRPSPPSTGKLIIGAVIGLVVLYVIFNVFAFLFKIIWWAAPIIFIASLVIDHKVFVGFIGTITKLFKRNWVFGLVAGILSIALFPLLAVYFLGMALFKKKLKEKQVEIDEARNGKWTDYEDVTPPEPDVMEIGYEELPPAPEPQPRKRDDRYDQLFD